MTTLFIIALFGGLTLATIALWGGFLRWGLRRVGARHVTVKRIAGLALFVIGLEVAEFSLRATLVPIDRRGVFLDLIGAFVLFNVQWLAIAILFRVGIPRAVVAWLFALIPVFLSSLLALAVVRPYLAQSFVSPTNAMAPTLLGTHWQTRCPVCGEPAFCSAVDPWQYGYAEPRSVICRHNFHVSQVEPESRRTYGADYFLALKFLEPQRWDVVVFQYPEQPWQLFGMRVVGLPGETIEIQDGQVQVNGKALEVPAALTGISYTTSPNLAHARDDAAADQPVWGSAEHPAQLGDDEYFVLGDFSECAKDSRLWQRSNPGWSPYAVPKQYIRGVVTHIYWPPSRWRILR